jgi:hypothetical protein
MKIFLLSLWVLALALPASATVSIEFQLGGIEVPAGSIGVLVADVDGNGDFTSPSSPEAVGAQLTYSAMIGGDVIIAVFSQSGLADWGTQKGFAAQMAVLDYASLGLAEGDELMLHIFPQRSAGQTLRAGEPHLSYRTDEIGQRTSNSTMGFTLPADGGAHLLAVIGPDQQGNADLTSLDLRNLPYGAGSGSFDRTLATPTARHTYYFELGASGFLSLDGIGGTGLVVQLIGPNGQTVYTGGGAEFSLYDTLASGLYTLVLSREGGGSGELAYELDFANSDVRFVVPDIAVGRGLTSLVGSNTLDGLPGQSVVLASAKANPVSGFATIVNRGQLPDTLAVRGSAGGVLCGIAYFDGAANVTAGLVTGGYRTAEITEGDAGSALRVQFSPNKKRLRKKRGERTKIPKETFSTLVRTHSTHGPPAMDAASIRVPTR